MRTLSKLNCDPWAYTMVVLLLLHTPWGLAGQKWEWLQHCPCISQPLSPNSTLVSNLKNSMISPLSPSPNLENSAWTPWTSPKKTRPWNPNRSWRTWGRGGWRRSSRFWTLESTSAAPAAINTTRQWATLPIPYRPAISSRSFRMIGAAPRVGPPRVSSRARASRLQIAGFAQNQQYGLGGNSLTSAQKTLFIYGTCSSFPSFWVATSYNSFCIMQPFWTRVMFYLMIVYSSLSGTCISMLKVICCYVRT